MRARRPGWLQPCLAARRRPGCRLVRRLGVVRLPQGRSLPRCRPHQRPHRRAVVEGRYPRLVPRLLLPERPIGVRFGYYGRRFALALLILLLGAGATAACVWEALDIPA